MSDPDPVTLLLALQTWRRREDLADHHACGVGEDRLQLAWLGPLPVDPGGPTGAP